MAASNGSGLVEHAIASLFPAMSPDEFAALKSDIQANGLREPVVLFDGRLLDGRHRYRACMELGIPCSTKTVSDSSAAMIALSLNLYRRHLSSSQKAAILVEAREILNEETKAAEARHAANSGRPKKGTEKPTQLSGEVSKHEGEAAERAAKSAGTNRQYVNDAQALIDESPELHAEVKSGKKTVPQAKNELRKKKKTAELEAKAAVFKDEQPTWTLIHADVLDGLQSVLDHHSKPRLIFADPPYNIGVDYGTGAKADKRPYGDYVGWFGDWISFCHELLTDDGSMWVMIGDEYAAEYATALKRNQFTIRSWVIWYETFGVNCQQNFNRTHRHIFYAVKNAKKFVFNESEVSRPSDRAAKYNDKRAPEDGKKILDDVWMDIPRLSGTCDERIPQFPTQLPENLVSRIVRCTSDPGDLVVDPFNGSGTTGIACIESGRKYVGIDNSETFIDLATKRLKAHG